MVDHQPLRGSVVAAIAAAVAAVLERAPGDLAVRSVRHLGPVAGFPGAGAAGPNLWALSGRQAQMAARRFMRRKGVH